MAFDWRIVPAIIFGTGVITAGVETHTPLSPTKPVLISDYGWITGSKAAQHVATIECVAVGAAQAIYVKNLEDLNQKKTEILLQGGAELTTLTRAKRLIHDRPASIDYDPGCVREGYFEMSKSRLLWSIIGLD